jgi:hypothetical protein
VPHPELHAGGRSGLGGAQEDLDDVLEVIGVDELEGALALHVTVGVPEHP